MGECDNKYFPRVTNMLIFPPGLQMASLEEKILNVSVSNPICDITGKNIVSEMNYYTFTILIDSICK